MLKNLSKNNYILYFNFNIVLISEILLISPSKILSHALNWMNLFLHSSWIHFSVLFINKHHLLKENLIVMLNLLIPCIGVFIRPFRKRMRWLPRFLHVNCRFRSWELLQMLSLSLYQYNNHKYSKLDLFVKLFVI